MVGRARYLWEQSSAGGRCRHVVHTKRAAERRSCGGGGARVSGSAPPNTDGRTSDRVSRGPGCGEQNFWLGGGWERLRDSQSRRGLGGEAMASRALRTGGEGTC